MDRSKCHLCAIKCDYYIEIFSEAGKQLEIAAIISQHFWFEIAEPTNLTGPLKIICHQCWTRLNDFHQFYTNIEKVQGRFEFHTVKVEDPDEEHDCSKDDDEKTFQKNAKNIVDDLSDIETEQLEDNEEDAHAMDSELIINDDALKRKTWRRGARAEKNAYLRTFFHMDCDICGAVCLSFMEARKHYQSVHNVPGYVTCCSKKFDKQRAMRDHVAMHVNPHGLICDICKKGFAYRARIREHMRTHIKPEDREFKCDQCTKAFLKQCALSRHQKEKHSKDEDKEFECDECGKRFAFSCVLRVHKARVHNTKTLYVCDICAKVYSTRASYVSHKKQKHGEPIPKTFVQCNICGITVKNTNLVKHTKIHNTPKQKCDFCCRILSSKQTLRKHIYDVHSNHKPFVCKVCGKEYRRALNLQEHMSTHTGEILYTCPFCPKTFNSGSNMYQHRRVMHPIEYQNSKLAQIGQSKLEGT